MSHIVLSRKYLSLVSRKTRNVSYGMSTGVLRFGTISVFRELSGNDNGAQGISAGKKMDLDFFL